MFKTLIASWDTLMDWLNTSYVPLWIVFVVAILYMCVAFWRDTAVLRRTPPPPDS